MSSYTKEENALVEVDTACGRHSSRSSQSKRKGDPVILSGEEVVVCISSTVSDSDGEISVDDSALDQAGQIGSPGCLIPPSDSKSGERAALVSASPLRSHPINSKQKTDDQLSCAVIVGDTVEDSKGSESDCHVIASQSHVTVGDSHVTIGESHVTGTAEDRECRGSFESITASDSQDIVNVLSQEDRLVSSPKKKKRARDPPITSPHSFDTEGKAGMQALLEAVPPVSEHFHVSSKIGEGTFSSVYLAHLKENPDVQFALKHIVPTSAPCRIENELRCLQTFGGRQHVIGLETCLRHRDHVVFVLPYVKHDRFFDFIPFMTIDETRQYMKALFLALQQVHSHHIIHRDIKPSNFLYNIRDRQYHLLDFGLAHLESGRTGMFGDSSVLSGGSRRRSTSAPAPSNRLRQSPRLLTKALNNPSSAHTKALNNPSSAHTKALKNPSSVHTKALNNPSSAHTKALKNPSSVHTKALNNPSSAHTAIVTMTPTLPHALSTNNRANGMVQPSPHAVLVALNSGSEKQPSEQIARSLSRKSGNFTTPSNKRVNKLEKDETKSSDMKRGKRAVEDQKRQSVSAKRPLRRGDSKQVKSKSATKLKRKFEESCDFDHKETEVCELCMGRYVCMCAYHMCMSTYTYCMYLHVYSHMFFYTFTYVYGPTCTYVNTLSCSCNAVHVSVYLIYLHTHMYVHLQHVLVYCTAVHTYVRTYMLFLLPLLQTRPECTQSRYSWIQSTRGSVEVPQPNDRCVSAYIHTSSL
jgi:hypothetical protein